ncbi:hypothetical protein IMZ48_34420, partial [Candidatus Bathyarchaeota archaeon]|nr:hypothetical protein [Candidatus Bathyarchaeota archaeon]
DLKGELIHSCSTTSKNSEEEEAVLGFCKNIQEKMVYVLKVDFTDKDSEERSKKTYT